MVYGVLHSYGQQTGVSKVRFLRQYCGQATLTCYLNFGVLRHAKPTWHDKMDEKACLPELLATNSAETTVSVSV